MRRIVRLFPLFFALLCLVGTGIAAAHLVLADNVTYTVQGHIFAPGGASPLLGCWVSVYDASTEKTVGSWTDEQGHYNFTVNSGTFVFDVWPPPASHYDRYHEVNFVVSSDTVKDVTLAFLKTQIVLRADQAYIFSGTTLVVGGNVELTNGTAWKSGRVRVYFDGLLSSNATVKDDGSLTSSIQLPIGIVLGWHQAKVEFVSDEPWLEGSVATMQVFVLNTPMVIVVAAVIAGVSSVIAYGSVSKRRKGRILPGQPTPVATVQTLPVELPPPAEERRIEKEAPNVRVLLDLLTELVQRDYSRSKELMDILQKFRESTLNRQGTEDRDKTRTTNSSSTSDQGVIKSVTAKPAKMVQKTEQLKQTEDTAKKQVSKGRRQSSSALIGYGLAGFGVLSLILSVAFTSTVVAFIGLGLTFWGGLLLFIRPRHYVRSDLMDSTALSSLASIDRVITSLGYNQKGVYIPVSNPEKAVVFIPSHPLGKIPTMEQVERRTFVKDPEGIAMVPPGLALANLFERELGVKFSEWSLDEMVKRLPKLLIEDLEMVQDCSIKVDGDHVSFRFVESVYSEFCSKLRSTTNVCSSLGCPMCSAMACILAQVSHRPVEFDKDKYTTERGTVESSYRLLPS
jgi:hypothetical protein